MFKFSIDLAITDRWLVVFIQRFLRALCLETNHPSWKLQVVCQNASVKPAGCQQGGMQGRALASAVLLIVRCLSSQQFQYSGWLSSRCMHVKSGLLQLWKVIACSKGYIRDCCFHQYPRHTWSMARHILQQRIIMMRNFSGALRSNYFPNWLQRDATRNGGSSSSPSGLHVRAA